MLLCDGEKLIDYRKLLLNMLIIILFNKFENFDFFMKNKGNSAKIRVSDN